MGNIDFSWQHNQLASQLTVSVTKEEEKEILDFKEGIFRYFWWIWFFQTTDEMF